MLSNGAFTRKRVPLRRIEGRFFRAVLADRLEMVGPACVFDQHDENACELLGIDRELSNAPWRAALAAGHEPPSWRNADAVRAIGADGIIDRSRMIPGGWHVNLFRWNELGGPLVAACGDPVEIRLSVDGSKWGL